MVQQWIEYNPLQLIENVSSAVDQISAFKNFKRNRNIFISVLLFKERYFHRQFTINECNYSRSSQTGALSQTFEHFINAKVPSVASFYCSNIKGGNDLF